MSDDCPEISFSELLFLPHFNMVLHRARKVLQNHSVENLWVTSLIILPVICTDNGYNSFTKPTKVIQCLHLDAAMKN